jgi:hypothetical protein
MSNDNVITLHTALRGMYKIEAVNMVTGHKRVLADWFPNLITTNGLNLMGGSGGVMTNCSVGSGSATPTNADTTLQTYVASTATTTSNTRAAQSSPPYYGTTTVTYRFAIGTATGNLAEVGVGPSTGGTNLFSRALILDSLGSPTTITVLSSEALDVTYQLQEYVPTVDVTGTVTIAGTPYSYTLRAANATSVVWSVYIAGGQGGPSNLTVGYGTINASVTGTASFTSSGGSPDSTSMQTYGSGNFYRDCVFGFGLTTGNATGGINCFTYNGGTTYTDMGAFQVQLGASIPKDATTVMTLTLRHSWGRYP